MHVQHCHPLADILNNMSDPMHKDKLWYVFGVYPHETEPKVEHSLLGRFWLHDGHFKVLESHGLDHDLDDRSDLQVARWIRAMSRSGHRLLVAEDKLHEHPNLQQIVSSREAPDQPQTPGPKEYEYHRAGMPGPQQLRFHEGKAWLDGHELAPAEVAHVVQTVKGNKATVRHTAPMQKAEPPTNTRPGIYGAVDTLRQGVRQDPSQATALETVTRHLFSDSMVPHVGNKFAYEDFMSRPRKGVHVRLDGVRFGHINKQFGFEAGDEAIKGLFGGVRKVLDSEVGRKKAKAFRMGGDEGHVFLPDHESAAIFARALRAHFDAVPPLNGTHKLAMDIGIGDTPELAEQSLMTAKKRRSADEPNHALRCNIHSSQGSLD